MSCFLAIPFPRAPHDWVGVLWSPLDVNGRVPHDYEERSTRERRSEKCIDNENLLLDTGKDGVLDLMNGRLARRCARNGLRKALCGVLQ